MIRVFLFDKQLIISKKNEKEFRETFGKQFEVVEIINDERNVHDVVSRLERVYKVPVFMDGKMRRKPKFGWKYMTDEQKERNRQAVKAYRTGRAWEPEVKEKISASRAGVGNFEGKRHRLESRLMTSLAMSGNSNSKGLRWAHDPLTGQEKRVRGDSLPVGFTWGRTAEIVDWFRKNRIV